MTFGAYTTIANNCSLQPYGNVWRRNTIISAQTPKIDENLIDFFKDSFSYRFSKGCFEKTRIPLAKTKEIFDSILHPL